MKPIAVCVLVVAGAPLLPCSSAVAQSGSSEGRACPPAGDLAFVCDLTNVEDLLPVDGGRWLVGSSYKAGSAGLYLIDTAKRTARPVSLKVAREPEPEYRGCAAPDLKQLLTHGLDVVQERDGAATVYAVNHGGREAVEIFRLSAPENSAEWVGCVLLPPGANGNAVAALPRGAFVVSKFMDTRDKQGFQHIMAGAVTGAVYLWQPRSGFSEVPGTRLSGDNGVAVSPDRKWLFVNAYGSREIYRVPLTRASREATDGANRMSVKVDFHPDNLRWAPDGTLFVTGQLLKTGSLSGPHGWATVRLDPRTMSITPVVKEPGRPQFDDATSTVQAGRTLWFGTFRGDRVAYRPAP